MGIMPEKFYASSHSDMETVLNAQSRKDRVQDPVEMARQAGLI